MQKSLAVCEALLFAKGACSMATAWSQRVPCIEDAGMRVDEDSCGPFGLEVGSVRLCRDGVLHGHKHVQIRLHAYQLCAETPEPRMRWLVVDHGRILLQARRSPRRRPPQQCVGHTALCAAWCPGRESNPHTFRLRILSPLRLPVSSPGLGGRDDSQNFDRDVTEPGAPSQHQLHRSGRAGADHAQGR